MQPVSKFCHSFTFSLAWTKLSENTSKSHPFAVLCRIHCNSFICSPAPSPQKNICFPPKEDTFQGRHYSSSIAIWIWDVCKKKPGTPLQPFYLSKSITLSVMNHFKCVINTHLHQSHQSCSQKHSRTIFLGLFFTRAHTVSPLRFDIVTFRKHCAGYPKMVWTHTHVAISTGGNWHLTPDDLKTLAETWPFRLS